MEKHPEVILPEPRLVLKVDSHLAFFRLRSVRACCHQVCFDKGRRGRVVTTSSQVLCFAGRGTFTSAAGFLGGTLFDRISTAARGFFLLPGTLLRLVVLVDFRFRIRTH